MNVPYYLKEDGFEDTSDDKDQSGKYRAWIVKPSEQGPNLTNKQENFYIECPQSTAVHNKVKLLLQTGWF